MTHAERFRFWGRINPATVDHPAVMAAPPQKASEGIAVLRLYDPIDPEGGEWGTSAKEFAAVLDSLPDGTNEIRLHLNSPGGDVFDGIAILNALRNHPARVVAFVDGVAASAASFVAAGADELVMGQNTQLMIHDAWGLVIGNATDMAEMAALLDKHSDNIASIYAAKAGGTTEAWRDTMRGEAWFTAEEAVESGLADRVEGAASDKALNRFDFSIFNYAGRSAAPAPKPPTASAGGSTPSTEGGSAVAFSDEQITNMRRKLGIAEDADEATILAALDEALAEHAEPTPTPTPQASAPAPPPTPQSQATALGTMVIDSSAWEEREARIKRLEAADAKRRVEERDDVIAAAVRVGKFPSARVQHWARLWDADPEGTRTVIAGLMPNVVPVSEIGYASMDDEAIDAEFAHLFPTSTKGA